MKTRRITEKDLPELLPLVHALWPDAAIPELQVEFEAMLPQEDVGIFLAEDAAEGLLGFAQCSLRHDYVEGTSTRPVGYLEGIYVHPHARRHGIARRLVACCEAFARERGCFEFASDMELHNEASYHFHVAMGFREVNRLICFAKHLSIGK